MILKLNTNAIDNEGNALLNEMKMNCLDDNDPEFEIIEILEENPNATEFEVSTNAGELLCETYPTIFK